ncbi:MAG: outer membrane protein assembly factor BamB family protein, partial [Planctomycetota bacterium]
SEGIYLYAVDASTGRTLWVNDSSGSLVLEQPHGGNRARSGVSIQGYLAIEGNLLAVPTGRATPAVFDSESGRFRYFHLMELGLGWGRRKGAGPLRKGAGPFVTFVDENLFIVEDDVFQASEGRFMTRGLPVSSTAVLPDMLVFTRGHEIKAIKKSSLWIEVKEDPNGPPVRKLSLDDIAWSIACSDPVGASVVRAEASNETSDWPAATQVTNPPLVVAGRTIVAGTLNSKIVTADIESRTVVTTADLDGLALGLAVAGRALYVATDKGTIYCFVPAEGDEAGRPDDRRVRPKPYRVRS